MKTLSKHQNRLFIFGCLVTCLIIIEFIITQTHQFEIKPKSLSFAVTIDIIVGIPTFFYLFIIRKLKINKITIVLAYVGSLGIAYFILPKTHHAYVQWGIKVLILLEIVILIYIILKIRTIVKDFKSLSKIRIDFYLNLKKSLEKSLGESIPVRIIASEIATIRYGLLPFLGKREVLAHQSFFTTHQKSGYIAIWCAILMAGFAELLSLHFLFAKLGQTAVLIADILSIYAIIFIVADLVAILRRPILIDNEVLILRIGLRWNVEILLSNIENIEKVKRLTNQTGILKAVAISESNILLNLKIPVIVTGFYGIRRETKKIALMVDDIERFEMEILRGC